MGDVDRRSELATTGGRNTVTISRSPRAARWALGKPSTSVAKGTTHQLATTSDSVSVSGTPIAATSTWATKRSRSRP